MRVTWLALGVTGLLIAADNPVGDAKKDMERMQGSWEAASGESKGNAIPDEQLKGTRFSVQGEKYSYKIGDSYQEEGTLKIDPTKKPKTIDVMIVDGEDKGEIQLGIYEATKDTLKLCFAPPGKEKTRPKDFSTNAGNQQLLLVLTREKS
jgi:uncharacterized protein (TIGR03067 family)